MLKAIRRRIKQMNRKKKPQKQNHTRDNFRDRARFDGYCKIEESWQKKKKTL